MKKTLFAALAAAVCGAMFAATDIVETMTVKLADGTEVEYEVSQVENVSFGTKEVSVLGDNFFKYYNKDGELTNQGDITGATKTVKSNGMWKVAFANEEGLNIFVELEPSLVGKTVDFATAADNSYAFRYDMIQIYAPGNEWKPAGTNGSFTLTDNGDGTLTFVADVTNQYVSGGVAGGSPEHVVIAYTGACEGLDPAPVVKEDYFEYFNKDGVLTNQGTITGATKTVKSNGMWKVTFANEEGINIFVELEPSLVGKTVDFATAADNSYAFRYDMIQIYAPGNEWKPAGTNGSFTLTDNGDGTLTFVADVTNQYVSGGVAGGSPEHVVIEYTGACEGLEAAPQVKNEITFFNPDGAQENYTAVSAVTMTTTSRGLSKYAFTVNDEDLAADYGKKFYIELDPSLVGTTVDVPASTSTINCYFAFIQVSGPNDEFRPVAKAGTVKIVDNNDGNVNIEVDLTESSNRRVVFTYSGALTK